VLRVTDAAVVFKEAKVGGGQEWHERYSPDDQG
jgi:hypothetical protein